MQPPDDPPETTDYELSADLEHAACALSDAEEVLVLTGAGVSAASGVPTFRGEDGLWKDHRPEELATPAAFRRDPRLVWEWYAWRRELVRGCRPNPAHLALARWSQSRRGVAIVTQNVDALHTEALEKVAGGRSGDDGVETSTDAGGTDVVGTDAEASGAGDREVNLADAAPLELHGSLFRVRCTACAHRADHRNPVETSFRDALPRCPECGALLRPDVVWFGESLDRRVLEAAVARTDGADACLVVGTSAVVQPAASLATRAVSGGAVLIEVNPESTPLTRLATHVFRGDAAKVVPALLDRADV